MCVAGGNGVISNLQRIFPLFGNLGQGTGGGNGPGPTPPAPGPVMNLPVVDDAAGVAARRRTGSGAVPTLGGSYAQGGNQPSVTLLGRG